MTSTATAYKHWDNQWQDSQARQEWLVPETAVTKFLPTLKETNVKRILDLGGGVGRHALLFASLGYQVSMTDLSSHGLNFARNKAKEAGIELSAHLADMATLPFQDEFFDYVLAWNVIYHGTREDLLHSLHEINRVLREGALFQATLLTKANHNFQVGHEVSKDTWINKEKGDKAHPHFYCNEKELHELFGDSAFRIIDVKEVEQSLMGSFHWNVVAEKKHADN